LARWTTATEKLEELAAGGTLKPKVRGWAEGIQVMSRQ
jgi:hypothetical protein